MNITQVSFAYFRGNAIPRAPAPSRATLRLCIDARGDILTRDTTSLVPGTVIISPDSPNPLGHSFGNLAPGITNYGFHPECFTPNPNSNQRTSLTPSLQTLPNNSEILTRQLRVGEYVNSLPSPIPPPQTAELIADDNHGSRARINGYVISPPSYRDVVSSSSPVASVIVDRPRVQQTQPRRILFAL